MTLPEYITRHLRVPFCWGTHDCVLFAAGWVELATGIDHLAEVPRWTTKREAMRALRAHGGLERLLDERFKRTHPNLAADGSLALYRDAICLFSGPHIVGPGPDGLNFINRMEAQCAWFF